MASKTRATRSHFKPAHNQFEANENDLRPEAFVSKLKDKKLVLFLHDLQRIKGAKNKLSARIYETLNEKNVVNL